MSNIIAATSSMRPPAMKNPPVPKSGFDFTKLFSPPAEPAQRPIPKITPQPSVQDPIRDKSLIFSMICQVKIAADLYEKNSQIETAKKIAGCAAAHLEKNKPLLKESTNPHIHYLMGALYLKIFQLTQNRQCLFDSHEAYAIAIEIYRKTNADFALKTCVNLGLVYLHHVKHSFYAGHLKKENEIPLLYQALEWFEYANNHLKDKDVVSWIGLAYFLLSIFESSKRQEFLIKIIEMLEKLPDLPSHAIPLLAISHYRKTIELPSSNENDFKAIYIASTLLEKAHELLPEDEGILYCLSDCCRRLVWWTAVSELNPYFEIKAHLYVNKARDKFPTSFVAQSIYRTLQIQKYLLSGDLVKAKENFQAFKPILTDKSIDILQKLALIDPVFLEMGTVFSRKLLELEKTASKSDRYLVRAVNAGFHINNLFYKSFSVCGLKTLLFHFNGLPDLEEGLIAPLE